MSSLANCFAVGVRLRLSWLAAFSFLRAYAFGYYLATHRFRSLPFTASSSCCPFGLPFGRPSRTECQREYNLVLHLRSVLLLHWAFRAFQPSCSRNILRNFRLRFSGPELNLPMNDWRFFLVVWTIRLLFSSNLWLFHWADPKVWMIRFFTQLRVFPRLHNFRVTFYRLPDISKIQHKWPGMQLFWDFCINFVSTYIINNCL